MVQNYTVLPQQFHQTAGLSRGIGDVAFVGDPTMQTCCRPDSCRSASRGQSLNNILGIVVFTSPASSMNSLAKPCCRVSASSSRTGRRNAMASKPRPIKRLKAERRFFNWGTSAMLTAR